MSNKQQGPAPAPPLREPLAGQDPHLSSGKQHKAASADKPRGGVLEAFKINQVSLRGFIARFTVSSHDIEDVCQEAFLRAYDAERNGTIEQPKAYLFRVAKNILINGLRSKSRSVTDYVSDLELLDILPEGDTLEANIIAQQRIGIYCEAIATLPKQCRRVMLLKKIYGLPTKEVARRLGLTTSTVEKHMTKGLKDCNVILAERYATVGDNPSAQATPSTQVAPSTQVNALSVTNSGRKQ